MTEDQAQSPAAPIEAAPPVYKLYPLKHMLWGTWLGGPLAATWMVAANFKRLGETRKRDLTLVIGGAMVIAMVGLAFFLDRRFGRGGNATFAAVFAIAARSLAAHFQGRDIGAHQTAGGRLESPWKSLAVTIAGLAQTVVCVGVFFSFVNTTVVVGGTHQITLEGTATEADARKLGATLTELGVFKAEGQSVMRLRRDPSGWTLAFMSQPQFIEQADVAAQLEPVAKKIRANVFPEGGKLRINLMNAYGLEKKWCELDPEDGHLGCR